MTLLLAWLRLFRLPNVFTAIADIGMGVIVARHASSPTGLLPAGLTMSLAAASACIYTAGMVLNDVFDLEIDRQERPFRPLPSGQIPVSLARAVGFGLLLAGIVLAGLAGFLYRDLLFAAWRPPLIAALLAGAVLLYDGGLKKTAAGPFGMGLCRFLNVLLGMSAGAGAFEPLAVGYIGPDFAIAAGIGLYIVGVTWFARQEADVSKSGQLAVATGIMAAAIVLLGVSLDYHPATRQPAYICWLLLGLVSITIFRRCLIAITSPDPKNVQAAVKQAILSLIVLDASIALVTGPPVGALIILSLMLPALLLGRWVYST
jgi:4-hydroxybenzoate polyprenyltransferase